MALGPKFCVYDKEDMDEFLSGMEISFAKYKWDKLNDNDDEEEDEDFTEEEKVEHKRVRLEMIRVEAKTRTPFVKEDKAFIFSMKRGH